MEHVLNSLKEAGVNEAYVVVHYMADLVRRCFGDGSKLGMKLHYVRQDTPRGTADAVSVVEPLLEDEHYLVAYGDLWVDPEVVKEVVRSHEREGPDATMSVVFADSPERYGVVSLKGDYVIEVVEKPAHERKGRLVNAGIYVLPREAFKRARGVRPSRRGELELTDVMASMIDEGRRILAVRLRDDSWADVGTPWDLLRANRLALSRLRPDVRGDVEGGANLIGNVVVKEGARVRSGAYIEGPALIDEGADVGPNCYVRPFTSIGKNVRIGSSCEVKNSIIMNGTHIGHLSYVGDSIVGEGCNLGAGTIVANLRFDERTVRVRVKDELVDSGLVKLGVILGDGVKTGVNVSLMPGVKVGNGSWIGPGLVVYEDVSPGSFLLLRQEVEVKKLS